MFLFSPFVDAAVTAFLVILPLIVLRRGWLSPRLFIILFAALSVCFQWVLQPGITSSLLLVAAAWLLLWLLWNHSGRVADRCVRNRIVTWLTVDLPGAETDRYYTPIREAMLIRRFGWTAIVLLAFVVARW